MAIATLPSIHAQLRLLRLPPGVPVLAHVALRRVGLGVRGAPALHDALLSHAAANDTAVIVPAFTYQCEDPAAWYEAPPPPGRLAEYQARTPAFDRFASPVHPDLGFLPEYLRRQLGALRSNHPVLSFAAAGPRAAAALAGQDLDLPLGPRSPLGWLCENGGVVLMVGTGLASLTLLHLAETLAPVSYVRATRRRVRAGQGWIWYWGAPWDSCGFGRAADLLEQATIGVGPLGCAQTRVVDAARLVRDAVARLRDDPGWLLCDDPSCIRCAAGRRYLAGEIPSIISGDQTAGDYPGLRAAARPSALLCYPGR